MTVVPSV